MTRVIRKPSAAYLSPLPLNQNLPHHLIGSKEKTVQLGINSTQAPPIGHKLLCLLSYSLDITAFGVYIYYMFLSFKLTAFFAPAYY